MRTHYSLIYSTHNGDDATQKSPFVFVGSNRSHSVVIQN